MSPEAFCFLTVSNVWHIYRWAQCSLLHSPPWNRKYVTAYSYIHTQGRFNNHTAHRISVSWWWCKLQIVCLRIERLEWESFEFRANVLVPNPPTPSANIAPYWWPTHGYKIAQQHESSNPSWRHTTILMNYPHTILLMNHSQTMWHHITNESLTHHMAPYY